MLAKYVVLHQIYHVRKHLRKISTDQLRVL